MLLQTGDDSYPHVDITFLDDKAGLKQELCDCVCFWLYGQGDGNPKGTEMYSLSLVLFTWFERQLDSCLLNIHMRKSSS